MFCFLFLTPYGRSTRYEEAFLPEGKKRPRSLRFLGLASLLNRTQGMVWSRPSPLLNTGLSIVRIPQYHWAAIDSQQLRGEDDHGSREEYQRAMSSLEGGGSPRLGGSKCRTFSPSLAYTSYSISIDTGHLPHLSIPLQRKYFRETNN